MLRLAGRATAHAPHAAEHPKMVARAASITRSLGHGPDASRKRPTRPKPKTQSPRPTDSLTHSLTHSLTSLTRLLTHSLIHSLTHSLIHSFTHPLTYVFTFPFSQEITPPRARSFFHPLSHSPSHSPNPSAIHSSTHYLTPSLKHSVIGSCGFWKKRRKIFARRRRDSSKDTRAQARVQSFERFYVAAIRYASYKKQGLKLYFDGRRVEPLEPA